MHNPGISVLFLAANPVSTPQLALDMEIRQIEDHLRGAPLAHLVSLKSKWAVRPDDLLRLLNDGPPDILHFSGHGTPGSELVLMGQDGTPRPVAPEALTSLFGAFTGQVRVVVLNSCYSDGQAASIVPNVDVTVGMRSEVGDEAARAFAAAFYRALAYGRTVQEAFEQSRVGMLLETGAGADIPVLRCRSGIDASTYVLFRREVVEDYAALGLAIGSPVRLFFGERSRDLEPLFRSSMMLAVVYQEFASLRAAEQLNRRVIEQFYGRALKELTLEVERTDALYASLSGARDRWIGVLGAVSASKLAKLLEVVAVLRQSARKIRTFLEGLEPNLSEAGEQPEAQREVLRLAAEVSEPLFSVQVSYTILTGRAYNELLESLPSEALAAAHLEPVKWEYQPAEGGPSAGSV
jgi:hypothetical protein